MSFPTIPGINSEAGLDLYGGEMDIYIGAMESYAANTPRVIDSLKNVNMDNLKDYAVNVHGLKSVSLTIGAEDLGEKAKKLEFLAKSGDLAGVLADNEELLKDANVLVEDIKKWLESQK